MGLALRTLIYKIILKMLCELCVTLVFFAVKENVSYNKLLHTFNFAIFQINCKMICWNFVHKFIEDDQE